MIKVNITANKKIPSTIKNVFILTPLSAALTLKQFNKIKYLQYYRTDPILSLSYLIAVEATM
jgi:hypothetical protein